MRKYLKILLILPFLASCVYQNQQVPLKFDLDTQISDIGNGIGVTVRAVDKRPGRDEVIGNKIYLTDAVVDVTVDHDLADFLGKKLMHSLVDRGFQYGRDKKIELQIRELSYHVKASFLGTAELKARVKMVIRDSKTGRVFSKKYGLEKTNRYFIMPLKSTVRKSVNEFLRDIVNDVAEDEVFMANLVR